MVEAEDVRQPKLGKLKPRYRFALNPHADYRASRCPNCDWLTYARKFALLIHVDPNYPLALGFTCCYCPKCELIIAHQDELEAQLTALFQERDPSIIGNDYLVLGTVELKVWKESLSRPKSIAEILEHAADFKEHVTIEYFPGSWYPKDFVPPIPPRHKARRKKK
jgi:hypothetical protein